MARIPAVRSSVKARIGDRGAVLCSWLTLRSEMTQVRDEGGALGRALQRRRHDRMPQPETWSLKQLEIRLAVRPSLQVSGIPPTASSRQHWRGVKLPSILTVPGCSTTTADHPSSAGRTHPPEADKYRDQWTRTTYSPGSGKDTVSETPSRAMTCPGGEVTGRGFVTA